MEAEPVVSIVIVSWNAKQYLAQCLESLSPESCGHPMDVVVVDNASSDGSPEYVAKKHPHVLLIRNESNLGFAKGNNIGIRASRGRYVCLVNSDVRVLPNCITTLVDFCETHPHVAMVGPRIIGGDGKLQRSCRGFPTLWNMACRVFALDALFPRRKLFGGYLMTYWAHDSLREVDILSGCFWLVRREAVAEVGYLDENFFMYGEDMDWCRRFWKQRWRLMFVPQAEAIHYGGASSAQAPVRFFIEKQRADLQYWRKHHGQLAQTLYFVISCCHHALRVIGHACLWLRTPGADQQRYKVVRSVRSLQWLLSPSTMSALLSRAL